MTLRELFAMATGRRREMRQHALTQSMLVWGLDSFSDSAIADFIRCGAMAGECPMPSMPEVDRKVAEIYANGGKLIV